MDGTMVGVAIGAIQLMDGAIKTTVGDMDTTTGVMATITGMVITTGVGTDVINAIETIGMGIITMLGIANIMVRQDIRKLLIAQDKGLVEMLLVASQVTIKQEGQEV